MEKDTTTQPSSQTVEESMDTKDAEGMETRMLPASTNEINPRNEKRNSSKFMVYPERWWVLITVILIGFSTYSHWASFAAVKGKVETFYNRTDSEVDSIIMMRFFLGIPCFFINLIIAEHLELKAIILLASTLNAVGAALCILSSLPGLHPLVPSVGKYSMAITGQGVTAFSALIVINLVNKVSQNWFSPKERTLATTILSLNPTAAMMISVFVTPLFVTSSEFIPYMNIIWGTPSIIGMIIALFKISSSYPPTPPSFSANKKSSGLTWFQDAAKIFSNRYFLILCFIVGAIRGLLSVLVAKMEQIMCSSGYSDKIAGLACGLVFLLGILFSYPMVWLSTKTRHQNMFLKVQAIPISFAIICLTYFLREPDSEGWIISGGCILGLVACGIYPLLLEQLTESVYPICQYKASIYFGLLVTLQEIGMSLPENYMGSEINRKEKIETDCVIDVKNNTTKDYSSYLNFLACYTLLATWQFVAFYRMKQKRTKEDNRLNGVDMNDIKKDDIVSA